VDCWHTPGSGGWGTGRGFLGRFRARTIANGVFVCGLRPYCSRSISRHEML